MHLADARQRKSEDVTDEEMPSTSGRPFGDVASSESSLSKASKV